MARKKHIDLIGERFGKLTVVDLIEIHRYPCGTVGKGAAEKEKDR